MLNPRFWTLTGIVLAGAAMRLIPHPPNFTPIAAMATTAVHTARQLHTNRRCRIHSQPRPITLAIVRLSHAPRERLKINPIAIMAQQTTTTNRRNPLKDPASHTAQPSGNTSSRKAAKWL